MEANGSKLMWTVERSCHFLVFHVIVGHSGSNLKSFIMAALMRFQNLLWQMSIAKSFECFSLVHSAHGNQIEIDTCAARTHSVANEPSWPQSAQRVNTSAQSSDFTCGKRGKHVVPFCIFLFCLHKCHVLTYHSSELIHKQDVIR